MMLKKRKGILLRFIAAMMTVFSLASCQYFVAPPVDTEGVTQTDRKAQTDAEVATVESGFLTPSETETADPGESGSLGEPVFELTDPEVEVPVLSETTMLADSEEPYNGGKAGCATLIVPAKYNKGLDYDIVATKNSTTKTYNLFLPCRMDASAVVMTVISNAGEERGPYLADFTDDEITENEQVVGNKNTYTVAAYQSNLPTMMLQIDEAYGTIADMNNDGDEDGSSNPGDRAHDTYCYGDVVISVTDEMALEKGWDIRYASRDEDAEQPCSMDMRGRGNATWGYSKKAYQIDCENSIALLGLDRGTKFVLLANFNDASFMRNRLMEALARQMRMDFVMESRTVDVFLNGKYLGIYQVAEKVEVEPNRVEIDRTDDILYEIDNYYKNWGDAGFAGKAGYRIHSPEDPATYEASKQLLLDAEKVLDSGDEEAVAALFDFKSWAKMFLIQEFMMNGDAFSGSLYFYYNHEDGKFYACSPWDFDWSLGLMWESGNKDPLSFTAKNRWWMKSFFTYPSFVKTLVDEYYNCSGRAIIANSPKLIEKWAQEIKLSAEMNSLGSTIRDLPYDGTTFDEAVDYLLSIIYTRIGWLDSQMEALSKTVVERPNVTLPWPKI